MSAAVVTKPQAQTRKAAKRVASRTLADARNDLTSVGQLLNTAYGAADPGDPIKTLLDHLMHDMLPAAVRPIFATFPTRADAHTTYEALFKPLACLYATMAVAKTMDIYPTLSQAFTLLDNLHTELDDVAPIALALPTAVVDQVERDFIRGRDIAIKMIEEGRALSGERDCYRRHRDAGAAQDNFVNGYLSDIIAEPALRRGFTSVLSQIVGAGECFDGSYFRHLSLAETQAGTPGEDGTEGGDDADVAGTDAATYQWRDETDEIRAIINEGISIVLGRLEPSGTMANLLQGAIYAARIAHDALDKAEDEGSHDDIENASAPLAVAQSVLDAALTHFDDLATWGALRLLEYAKERLDAEVERGMRSVDR